MQPQCGDYFCTIMVTALPMHPIHQTQNNHLGLVLESGAFVDIRLVLARGVGHTARSSGSKTTPPQRMVRTWTNAYNLT